MRLQHSKANVLSGHYRKLEAHWSNGKFSVLAVLKKEKRHSDCPMHVISGCFDVFVFLRNFMKFVKSVASDNELIIFI